MGDPGCPVLGCGVCQGELPGERARLVPSAHPDQGGGVIFYVNGRESVFV